jgi:lysyl endopeptidase
MFLKRFLPSLICAALLVGSAPTLSATATTDAAGELRLPNLDLAKLASEDLALAGKMGAPLRYGRVHAFAEGKRSAAAPGLEHGGRWLSAKDGMARWTLELEGPQARNLALYFDRFRLPAGATLEVYAADDKVPALRFDDRDNSVGGDLRTPIVLAGRLRLLLSVPQELKQSASLRLHSVVQGYRDPFTALNQAKSGSCNIDIACPEGDAWRQQSRAVAHYTANDGSGAFVCTGQLVATGAPALDVGSPRFLTAHHCVSSAASAASMTLYWKYESATCRTPGGAASGSPLPRTISAATQSGTTLLATHEATDFTAVALNTPVPAAAQAYYSGWDRSGVVPTGAVSIHHPAGDEKRIAIDLDPLTRMPNCIIDDATDPTHWRIGAWNRGTTEGGSSGAGLWHPQSQRLIGVLTGGIAACNLTSGYDCFGALDRGWDGGGTAGTRMRDWIDRTGAAPQVLDGHNGCNAPTANLDSAAFASPPRIGDLVSFTASASGGSGSGYSYEWDLNGDGIYERRGTANSVGVRYARAHSGQVRLRVTDSSGCPGSVGRALDVRAPNIVATASAPTQVCGNGNAGMDPGERWSLPVTLTNSGPVALAAGSHALFANGSAGSALPGLIGSNSYGYQATTSAGGGALCGYSFVDIGDAAALPLTDDDDGRASLISLGGSGLRLYGETFTQAAMSTNGYISFSTLDIGTDYDNSCTGEIDNASVGPRLHVLHDDLRVLPAGGLRYRYYASCPRAAAVGGAQPCHVFQWDGVELFSGGGDASFQAIAYAGSGELAYQYRRADPSAGGGATIGVIDREGSDPLNARCDTPAAAPGSSAICLFEPQNLPVPNQVALLLERAALPIPALAPGASAVVQVPVRVPEGSACGAPVAIDYLATAAPGQHSMQPSMVLSAQLASACSAVSSCPAASPPAQPRRGFFSDTARGGNGLALFQYGDAASPVTGAIWYTGDGSYLSDWYTFAGPWRSGLVETHLFRSRNLQPAGFQPESVAIARAWVASIDARTQLFAWDFGGGDRGAELMATTAGTLPFASPDHTNAWIQSGQTGWGLGVEGVQLADGPLEFYGVYFYDANGASRWLTGTSRSAGMGIIDLLNQRVHCPGCPYYPDYATLAQPAGTLDRTYTSRVRAQMSTNISLPAPLSGSWNRSNVTIEAFGVSE